LTGAYRQWETLHESKNWSVFFRHVDVAIVPVATAGRITQGVDKQIVAAYDNDRRDTDPEEIIENNSAGLHPQQLAQAVQEIPSNDFSWVTVASAAPHEPRSGLEVSLLCVYLYQHTPFQDFETNLTSRRVS
jgi:hypothetical protein